MKKLLIIALSFIGYMGLQAQELQEIPRSSVNENEHFGWSIVKDEDWMVIGSPHSESNMGEDAGKVIVYRRTETGWEEFQQLFDAAGDAFENYGFSVDLQNGVLVVGAIGTFQQGPFTGEAFVYEYNGTEWEQTAILEAPDGLAATYFGYDVSTNGNMVVAGAIKGDGNETESGAVYVFEKNNGAWEFTHKLIADDGKDHDNFGYALDINTNNMIAVGAPNQADFIDQSGAVYVFTYNGTGFEQQAKLKAFNRTEKDFLGSAVDLNGNELAVGAFLADGFSNNTGVVYFFTFENETWVEKQQVAHPDSELNDYFGRTVAMTDVRLFIGAPKADGETGKDVGRAYYYEKEDGLWVLKQVMEDPEPTDHNYFGASLTVSDFSLAISARMDDGMMADGGAVWTADLATVTSTENPIELQESISLINYPNPASEQITIYYELLETSSVALEIFDNNAQPIKKLVPFTKQAAGEHEVTWDLSSGAGGQVASGVYFYKLAINGAIITRKIIVSR